MYECLKQKHEEAKDLLLRSLVTNNILRMLDNPMNEEKISFPCLLSGLKDLFPTQRLFSSPGLGFDLTTGIWLCHSSPWSLYDVLTNRWCNMSIAYHKWSPYFLSPQDSLTIDLHSEHSTFYWRQVARNYGRVMGALISTQMASKSQYLQAWRVMQGQVIWFWRPGWYFCHANNLLLTTYIRAAGFLCCVESASVSCAQLSDRCACAVLCAVSNTSRRTWVLCTSLLKSSHD